MSVWLYKLLALVFCVNTKFVGNLYRRALFCCLIYIYGHHRGCLNNPIFSNLGLCIAYWACFICHHELWPTWESHPFSYLNSSVGFAGGKHYQKITIAVFRLVLQNFTIPGCFTFILFYRNLFSLLSSGLFVIAVCGCISVQGIIQFL